MPPIVRVFAAVLLTTGLLASAATAADLQPEKKAEMEQLLVGDWAVPENKYETTIEFSFADDRTFACTYTEPKQDPVNWAGHWRVRTTRHGVRAFLKGQREDDSEKWMKAVVRSNDEMDIFAILITWDFQGDASTWQSALEKGGGEDEEAMGEEGEEEDFDLEEDEDLDWDEDEDLDWDSE